MKKIIILLLVAVVLCGSLFLFSNNKNDKIEEGKFNSIELVDDFELNVNSSLVIDDQLNGDQDHLNEFLTTKRVYYGTVLCDIDLLAKEGQTMIVVSYTLKNTDQSDKTFNSNVTLKYNDNYEYTAYKKYYTFGGNDDWHEYTSLNINPLTTVMCKALFTVPEEVAENTNAPLKLIVANKEYTIR